MDRFNIEDNDFCREFGIAVRSYTDEEREAIRGEDKEIKYLDGDKADK